MFSFFFSDASSLKEAEHVRDSQEKVVQALQQYTYKNYPSLPSKFADMLLRIPELHRVCQVSTYYLIIPSNCQVTMVPFTDDR